jgi:hypothetical protein
LDTITPIETLRKAICFDASQASNLYVQAMQPVRRVA